MRYRRLTYRSAILRISAQPWPFGSEWDYEALRLLVHASGSRLIWPVSTRTTSKFSSSTMASPSRGAGTSHRAARTPWTTPRVSLPLPVRIDPAGVELRYDRGLLHVTLPKQS